MPLTEANSSSAWMDSASGLAEVGGELGLAKIREGSCGLGVVVRPCLEGRRESRSFL